MSRLTMAARTAGRLGRGGGPSRLFPPPRLCEAARLQEGAGDHCHQRVPVEACPRSTLEVIKSELFLQLLVGLLTYPAGLDGGGERPEIGVGGQVREIVFLLAAVAELGLSGISCLVDRLTIIRPWPW